MTSCVAVLHIVLRESAGCVRGCVGVWSMIDCVRVDSRVSCVRVDCVWVRSRVR